MRSSDLRGWRGVLAPSVSREATLPHGLRRPVLQLCSDRSRRSGGTPPNPRRTASPGGMSPPRAPQPRMRRPDPQDAVHASVAPRRCGILARWSNLCSSGSVCSPRISRLPSARRSTCATWPSHPAGSRASGRAGTPARPPIRPSSPRCDRADASRARTRSGCAARGCRRRSAAGMCAEPPMCAVDPDARRTDPSRPCTTPRSPCSRRWCACDFARAASRCGPRSWFAAPASICSSGSARHRVRRRRAPRELAGAGR